MSYQLKYLKYKTKYLALNNKIHQLGGLKTASVKLEEYVTSGHIKKHDFKITDGDFTLLTAFFNKLIKTKDTGLLPIDSIDDYIGKLNITDADLKKLGFYYNKKPSNGDNVYMTDAYSYTNNKIIYPLTTSIKYDSSANTITFNGNILQNPVILGDNVYQKLYNIIENIKIYRGDNKEKDQEQASGLRSPESWIYTNSTFISIIQNCKDCFGDINLIKDVINVKKQQCKLLHYTNHNLLIIIAEEEFLVKYKMYYVIKKDNVYEIFPHSYLNPILDDTYTPPVKKLFKNITDTLTTIIIPSNKYVNSPDRFFHIHVTPVKNENFVLLTLHALYEITNDDPPSTDYKYNTMTIIRPSMADINSPLVTKIKNRKVHNFYILYNLNSNTHFIYNVDKLANNNSFFSSDNAIGIRETIFGDNIIDINYIGKDYNVTISTVKQECKLLCNDDKSDDY